MCHGKLIEAMVLFRVQPESDQRQPFDPTLGEDDETQLFQACGQIVGRACYVHHDAAVPLFAKANHLVVLTNDLRSTLGEIQGERSLISSKVIDVEDQLLGKVLLRAPNHPSDTGIHLTSRSAGLGEFGKQ